MDTAATTALLTNAAILLVLSVVLDAAYRIPARLSRLQPVFSGLMIVAICFAVMNVPFTPLPGMAYDTRSILISVTALMFGLVPTAMVTVAAVVIRLSAGGAGMIQGLAIIVISALIGLGWRHWIFPNAGKWRVANAFLMGVAVHTTMLLCTLLTPNPDPVTVLTVIALPVMTVFPTVTALLCLVLIRRKTYQTEHAQMEHSEAQLKQTNRVYQSLFQDMVDAFALHEIVLDGQGKPVDYRLLSVNKAFENMTGRLSADILGKSILQIMPEAELPWIETYATVALTGEPIRFENYARVTDKYYEVSAYRTSPTQLACTFVDITKRVRADEATKKILSRLQCLLINSPSPIVIVDEKGKIIEVSAVARRILGLPDDDKPEKEIVKIAPPEIVQKVLYILSQPTDTSPSLEGIDIFEFDGTRRYFESRLFPIHAPSSDEKLFGYLAIDVTDRIKVEDALKASGEKYSNYIEHAPYAVFVIDEEGRCLEANTSATTITGYPKGRLVGMTIYEITTPESMALATQDFEELKIKGATSVTLSYLHASGNARWWKVDVVKLAENRYLGFASDITDKRKAEAGLLHLSYHDYLTGLYNRRYFEAELKNVDSPSQLPLSVFIGDINGVKLVNDTFGHAVGDRLIVDCADIIRDNCRSQDTVARIGGDEFGILMPKTDSATAIGILAKIQEALTAFDAKTSEERFVHSVSLGFGIKRYAEEDVSQTLRIAEEYMYQRKLLEHGSSHSAIISSIKATMIEKSHETEEHAERLVALSKAFAIALHLPQADQDRLELLATLHDIGKVGVSDSILTKKGILTANEWVEMKRHPEIGYRIAISTPELIPVAESILCHHEQWDGNGYPQGLSGEQIPLLSRIIAIVDAYDAMTHDRPYRNAMTSAQALAEIERNAGTQFDPHISPIFVAIGTHLHR